MVDAPTYGKPMPMDAKWHWEVHPMTFGKARVMWTDGFSVEEFYCMENHLLGILAHRDLVLEGKPPETGWTRKFVDRLFHYPDGRVSENGSDYVYPDDESEAG